MFKTTHEASTLFAAMQVQQLEWPYTLPKALKSFVQPTGTYQAPFKPAHVPEYSRPAFCDLVQQDAHNAQFLRFPNHPCTYLAAGIQFPETVPEVFAAAA